MPDGSGRIANAPLSFARAATRVGEWLSTLGRATPLSERDLEQYPQRKPAAGWRLQVETGSRIRTLELLLFSGFPWRPPRVALVAPPTFLTWPHVEVDGLLCLAPNTLTTDADDPVGVVAVTLQSARELIDHLTTGDIDADFRDEFLTYWNFSSEDKGPSIVSLINPAPPTRKIHVWRGGNNYMVGETPQQLRSWLVNLWGGKPEEYKTQEAAFLWAGQPLLPRDYPALGGDFRAFAEGLDSGADLLGSLAQGTPDKIVTVFGFETSRGPALAGCVVSAPSASKHGVRQPLVRGFRAGHVPSNILMGRYFGGGRFMRRKVERADAGWIHGRGHDPRTATLGLAHVAVLGCGSVGGPMAVALAQAGVGRMSLVDPDALSWANVGRHPLGASAVGRNKAKLLAQKLRTDFPHLTADHYEVDVEEMVREHAGVLEGCNLIVSATGSWEGDGRLEAWRIAAPVSVPVVFAWTEAHACAGHAVLIGGSGCFRCGFDKTGRPNFEITAWPNGSLRSEPACGAIYQPYGPAELAYVNTMATELVLDALLGKASGTAHRIWIAPAARLEEMGGAWTKIWKSDSAFRSEGGLLCERLWAVDVCPRCKAAIAA